MMNVHKNSKGYSMTLTALEVKYLAALTRNHEKGMERAMYEATTAIQFHEVNDERRRVKTFADRLEQILTL